MQHVVPMPILGNSVGLDYSLEKTSIRSLGNREKAREIAVLLMSPDRNEQELGRHIIAEGISDKLTIALFKQLAAYDGGVIPAAEAFKQASVSLQVRVLRAVSSLGFGFFVSGLMHSEFKEPTWRDLADSLNALHRDDYLRRVMIDVVKDMPKHPIFLELYLGIPQHNDQLEQARELQKRKRPVAVEQKRAAI